MASHSVQNADYGPQTGYKMQTENLYCFFVWYVITWHLTTYRASRKCFSAIIFRDYLHYCGIFLACLLITIVLNFFQASFSILIFRASWLAFYQPEFTNLLKVDVDVNGCHYWIFNLRNIREIHLFNRYVFILLTKMRTKTRTFLSTWYIFNVQKCTHTDFPLVSYLSLVFMRNRRIFIGKSQALPSWLAIC